MIKQITLTNFYSFGQETINLHPELNILVGINGAGKSNFLKAIRLLQEGMSDTGLYKYISERLGTFDNLYFKGKAESNDEFRIELEYLLDYSKINNRGEGNVFKEDLLYTITIVRSPSNQNYFVKERLSGTSSKSPFIYLEFNNGHGKISERSKEGGNKRLIQYDDYDPQQLALSKINDGDRYHPQNTIRKALRDIVVYDTFDTSPTSEIRRSSIPRSEKRLSSNGGNLAQILLNIKNQNRPDYTKLIQAAKEVNPYFSDFGTNILPGGSIEMMLGEDGLNSSIHVSGISDGTLRYLCLLAILYNSDRGRLICIDEPEVGLHPDMIHNIANAIRYASEKSTIVLSTHSVALLNQFELDHVRVFDKNDQNESIVNQFSDSEFAGWYEEFSVGNMWQSGDLGGRRYGR